ncbi:MAG: TrmB family transcriptional regulator [Candidatus Helarchaeota archaeon]
MREENIIEQMAIFGITENDAKIYLHLAKYGKQKLSRISQECGIPRSRVYESLTRLISNGYVFKELTAKQPRYVAIDTETLIGFLKSKTEIQRKNIENLNLSFSKLMLKSSKERKVNFIDDPKSCKEFLDNYINTAKKSIIGLFIVDDDINPYFLNTIFPTKNLLNKAKTISKIEFVFNKSRTDKTFLKKLTDSGIKLSFWNGPTDIPVLVLIIDDKKILLFSYSTLNFKFEFIDLLIIENMKEYSKVFNYLYEIFKLYNKKYL